MPTNMMDFMKMVKKWKSTRNGNGYVKTNSSDWKPYGYQFNQLN